MISPNLRSSSLSISLKPWSVLAVARATRVHSLLISLHACNTARIFGH
jgi:hypothetical protein